MPTHTTTDVDTDEYDDIPEESGSLWPVLLTAGSALALGYFVGRISYQRDLDDAIRQLEESSEPLTVTIRTL